MQSLAIFEKCRINVHNSLDIQDKATSIRVALSISLALLAHTVIILVIARLIDPPKPDVVETIYVRLTAPGISHSKSSVSDTAIQTGKEHAEVISDDEYKVTTLGQSAHQVASIRTQDNIDDYSTEPQPLTQSDIPNPTPFSQKSLTSNPVLSKHSFQTLPSVPSAVSSQENSLNLNHLFDQKQIKPAKIKQISTRKKKSMTDYEIKLIQHMANAKNYQDTQFKLSQIKQERNIELGIQLQSNGALESARVLSSSGLQALDAATLRSAYSASPFPKPPASHSKNNFTYELDIQYLPRHN
ncbi:MAG: hypothetical protein CSA50_03420 [Gammaproteobacteria bacterium]|nr:MAG: hypothetical protein CSA50_03420 [Gammaproteobacteria bacterium]